MLDSEESRCVIQVNLFNQDLSVHRLMGTGRRKRSLEIGIFPVSIESAVMKSVTRPFPVPFNRTSFRAAIECFCGSSRCDGGEHFCSLCGTLMKIHWRVEASSGLARFLESAERHSEALECVYFETLQIQRNAAVKTD